MGIGIGIALLVVGAILSFAVRDNVPGVDLSMVGYICMGAGVLAIILGLVLNTQATRTKHTEPPARSTLPSWNTATTWSEPPPTPGRGVTTRPGMLLTSAVRDSSSGGSGGGLRPRFAPGTLGAGSFHVEGSRRARSVRRVASRNDPSLYSDRIQPGEAGVGPNLEPLAPGGPCPERSCRRTCRGRCLPVSRRRVPTSDERCHVHPRRSTG